MQCDVMLMRFRRQWQCNSSTIHFKFRSKIVHNFIKCRLSGFLCAFGALKYQSFIFGSFFLFLATVRALQAYASWVLTFAYIIMSLFLWKNLCHPCGLWHLYRLQSILLGCALHELLLFSFCFFKFYDIIFMT